MIFLSLYFFKTGNSLDLLFDEQMKIGEFICEVSHFISDCDEGGQIISSRRKCVLKSEKSFIEEGILGGDNLIYVN